MPSLSRCRSVLVSEPALAWFPLRVPEGTPPRQRAVERLLHRATYQVDLSPRIQQIRISSSRKMSPSPQTHQRASTARAPRRFPWPGARAASPFPDQ